MLVRFSQSLCTNAVTLHQVTDVVTDQLITLPFLFWCVWLFVCFGFACGFGWFFVCFVVCFVCAFSVGIVTANRTLYCSFFSSTFEVFFSSVVGPKEDKDNAKKAAKQAAKVEKNCLKRRTRLLKARHGSFRSGLFPKQNQLQPNESKFTHIKFGISSDIERHIF